MRVEYFEKNDPANVFPLSVYATSNCKNSATVITGLILTGRFSQRVQILKGDNSLGIKAYSSLSVDAFESFLTKHGMCRLGVVYV